MKRHLKLFANSSDYETFLTSNAYVEPHISMICDNYNKPQYRYKKTNYISCIVINDKLHVRATYPVASHVFIYSNITADIGYFHLYEGEKENVYSSMPPLITPNDVKLLNIGLTMEEANLETEGICEDATYIYKIKKEG